MGVWWGVLSPTIHFLNQTQSGPELAQTQLLCGKSLRRKTPNKTSAGTGCVMSFQTKASPLSEHFGGAEKVNTLYIVSGSAHCFTASSVFTLAVLFPLPCTPDRGRILARASSRSTCTSSTKRLPRRSSAHTISQAFHWT